mgnify:CR=1 FL=1
MSLNLRWEKFDEEFASEVEHALNEQLKKTKKPEFLADISVSNFSFGDSPPQISIADITEPFEEFYETVTLLIYFSYFILYFYSLLKFLNSQTLNRILSKLENLLEGLVNQELLFHQS